MKIRHLEIAHFRGIQRLNWSVNGDFICLIGPCDSGKSTILQAIYLALCPTWNPLIDDFDFENANTGIPIEITISIGELPDSFLSEDSQGLYLRGWNLLDGIVEAPTDDHEPIVSIKLHIDEDREPKWTIFNERLSEDLPISAKARASLLAVLMKDHVDRDLTWSRGSSLARLTGGLENAEEISREAERTVRGNLPQEITTWADICTSVQAQAQEVGVTAKTGFRVGVDMFSNGRNSVVLGLFDGAIPLRNSGLGSKKLTTLKIQHSTSNKDSIVMLDEIEHGLEPHRLRHLIRKLRPTAQQDRSGQVIFTTHSPVAIVESKAEEVKVITNNAGQITIKDLPLGGQMQSLLRRSPEAFLAKQIVVCEGSTEVGFCRALDEHWERTNSDNSFATKGIVATSSGGRTSVGQVAISFKNLGYKATVFADSDEPIDKTEAELSASGIGLVMWGENVATEQRIIADVPIACLQKIVDLAISFEILSEEIILSHLNTFGGLSLTSTNISQVISGGTTEENLRVALGTSAKRGGWFKDISRGEELGKIVTPYLLSIPESDLFQKTESLKEVLYGTT